MNALKFSLVFLLGTASLLPAAALMPPGPREVDAILTEGFPSAAGRIGALLRENYRPGTGSMPSNAGQPAFRAWYGLGMGCRLFAVDGAGLDPAFEKAVMAHSAFSPDFLPNLAREDDAAAVLKILQELWQADPARFWQYFRLAIALALVFDQPPPADWPHDQTNSAALPQAAMPPAEAFAFWIESDKTGKLYADPKTLGVDQLKFMVDVFLPASELRWAQKNARFPRANFGKAFSSITYDYSRTRTRQYDWPHESYSLEEIRKQGGICVDQAYFAAIAGKANGLPTLFFSGQGTSGGHAWFGYLKGANRWELDCGRYENQNYAVGEALDPQTWQPINDAELDYLSKPSQRGDAFRQSQIDLGMARLYQENQQPDKALAAVNSAIALAPENVAAWKERTSLLNDPSAQKAHFEKALNQFPANREVRVFFQKELADWHRRQGDAATAEEWERKIISQNRSGRSDLSIAAAAGGLAALVEARKMDEAMKEYRSLLGRLGRKGGGNFYYEIVAPFTESLIKAGDSQGAGRALELARRTLQPDSGSILDQEFQTLETRVKAVR
ncbi:MAG TPA: hypothetical protein VIS74_00940 [Chthoniobacterales bacterium]